MHQIKKKTCTSIKTHRHLINYLRIKLYVNIFELQHCVVNILKTVTACDVSFGLSVVIYRSGLYLYIINGSTYAWYLNDIDTITCCHVTRDLDGLISTDLTIGIDGVDSRLGTGICSFQLEA